MSTATPTDTARRAPWRFIALMATLAVVGFSAGYLGTWPPVATVMSGSMEPKIGTGDMVVFKHINRVPRVGEVVAVPVPDQARSRYGYPPEVVHRVVRVSPTGAVTTKGEAKPTPDPFTVPASVIRNRVLFSVPAVGRVIAFLSSPMGLFWLAAGAVLLIGLPLFERRQEAERHEQDALEAMREELHTISQEITRLRTEPVAPVEAVEPVESPEPAIEPVAEPADTPTVDWTELETTPDPDDLHAPWPEPPEFLPAYEPVGHERVADPEPEPEPLTYVVRRRSGGLLARLR
jgi:signal peptidase I